MKLLLLATFLMSATWFRVNTVDTFDDLTDNFTLITKDVRGIEYFRYDLYQINGIQYISIAPARNVSHNAVASLAARVRLRNNLDIDMRVSMVGYDRDNQIIFRFDSKPIINYILAGNRITFRLIIADNNRSYTQVFNINFSTLLNYQEN